jgi:hypothetical protein
MRYRCPVCLFDRLPYPPTGYHICPCCSTEFGNDDAEFSHLQLREMWVGSGAFWFFGNPPANWNPWMQLVEGGHPEAIPHFQTNLKSEAATRIEPRLIMPGASPYGLLAET